MLVAALLIVPTLFAPSVDSDVGSRSSLVVAAAAHQWWSANLFTSVERHVSAAAPSGRSSGIGGFAGAMSAMRLSAVDRRRFSSATGGQLRDHLRDLRVAYVVALAVDSAAGPEWLGSTVTRRSNAIERDTGRR